MANLKFNEKMDKEYLIFFLGIVILAIILFGLSLSGVLPEDFSGNVPLIILGYIFLGSFYLYFIKK